nr:hypothetical protein [uncultured Cupriavidus sp.]
MNMLSAELPSELPDARRQVEAYFQSLVDIGEARWLTNDDGDIELHLEGGEAYLLGEFGVTRLK